MSKISSPSRSASDWRLEAFKTASINLLPPEIQQVRESRQRLALVVAAVIIVFSFFAMTYLALTWRLYHENKILAQLQEDNIKLKKTLAEYKEFETWRNELKKRNEVLGMASASEIRWSFILDEMSMVIPTDVWLNSFSGDGESGLKIQGYTFNHPAVAKWMVRFADVKKIKNIDLSYSQATEIEQNKLIEFQTTGELIMPETKVATAQAQPQGAPTPNAGSGGGQDGAQ